MGGPFGNTINSAWAGLPVEREIALSQVIDAPREDIYAAWVDPNRIQLWFGPDGLQIETRQIDLRPGGVWHFDLVESDGARHSNRIFFVRMEAPSLVEAEYVENADDDPKSFRLLVTLDEQVDGKTVTSLRYLYPSKERRGASLRFGAVEFGGQTLERLAQHVAGKLGTEF